MGRTAVMVMSLLLLGSLAPAAVAGRSDGADPAACRVENASTRAVVLARDAPNVVQAAIDAASNGDVLLVTGVCVGGITIDRDLTLRGRPTWSARVPTLDGGGSGTVVRVESGRLTIAGLIITHGSAPETGGGIHNVLGIVVLRSTAVVANTAPNGGGGGIYNETGSLDIRDSIVSGNAAGVFFTGGGIYNAGGTLRLASSVVRGNSANSAAGIFNDTGAVTLVHSIVRDNVASFQAGGIFNSLGNVTVSASTVSDNTAFTHGGIFNFAGGMTITGSTISANTGNLGGGIANGGTMTLADTLVARNAATSTGGGILNSAGQLTLAGSTRIQRNTAGTAGGGIALTGGIVSAARWSGAVFRNTPDDCSPALTIGTRTCH